MFDIGAPEFLLLIVAAVILFGPEKLPEFARKAARVVSYVRNIAGNAQSQLGKELGPGFENLDVRDLNPRTFIQKHLLDDVEPIMADVKSELADATSMGKAASKDVTDAIESAKSVSPGGPSDVMAAATPVRVLTPFDPDAT
ncbi:MAG: sec-independent translocase [Propionibacteriaceae bacterium]